MPDPHVPLMSILEGWDTYETSLVHAVAPLTAAQLEWRPAPSLRSVGETAGHIALGRIDWFSRMGAPGSQVLSEQFALSRQFGSNLGPQAANDASRLVEMLDSSWKMVEANLKHWAVPDLFISYRLEYQGQVYSVSRQWTVWRILSHDVQHGGQIALMLGMQGIPVVELGDLGGHLNMPPLAGA
jgi:uncharacterized damage-inducible protein DinB